MSLATLWALTVLMPLFVVGFIGFAAVSTASAALPGKNGKLIFDVLDQGNDTGKSGIATANPSGTGFALQLDSSTFGGNAIFAPNGRSIAYADWITNDQDQGNGSGRGIYSLPLGSDQSEARLIWPIYDYGLTFYGPISYSPNGREILLTHFEGYCDDYDCTSWTPDPKNGIYVYDLKATSTKRLEIPEGIFPQEAIFSPNGKKIAVVSTDGAEGPANVGYTLNADGSNPKKFVKNDGSRIIDLSYSPDGKRVLFTNYENPRTEMFGLATNIYSIRTNGSGEKKLTDNNVSTNASYAPDGTRIAFSSFDPYTGNGRFNQDIWMMGVDGTGKHRITPNPGSDHINTLLDWGRAAPFKYLRFKRRRSLAVIRVFGPGKIFVRGPHVARKTRTARSGGIVRVPIRPKANVKLRRGARVKVWIRFAPKGGLPSSRKKYVKLP
ncbi:MAG: PD40 domain-containing protein [Solirubrobacterales bacterium]|nr:PD40 domain-containing protein [Solirubrobacterales bacterium]